MIDVIEADDAWWPPTFTPDGVWRTLLAWWTMLVASHSTRRWTASSVSRSTSGAASAAGEVPRSDNDGSVAQHLTTRPGRRVTGLETAHNPEGVVDQLTGR